MVDFSKLKANSGKKSLEDLNAKLAKLNENNKTSDDRFWSPDVDKAGNGYAVLRFLPAPGEEDFPFVRVFDHGFQGPGGWYIENSLTTIGLNDPVSEFNSKLWNSTTDDKSDERKQARDQKRRLHYISNVYVVSDPTRPENEGKVFLFKYGKKIFDKLNEAMNPQFADEVAVNPFDMWKGANFKLKIRKVEGYRNYDKSEFDKSGPLFDDDDKLEVIWKSEHSLQSFLDPKNFKSYDDLKARLAKVLGDPTERADTVRKAEDADLPWAREDEGPKFKAEEPSYSPSEDNDEDDASLDYFKGLINKN
jgi:hypothetical protein